MSEPKEGTRRKATRRVGTSVDSGSRIEAGIDWLERRRERKKDEYEEGALRGQRLRDWTEKLVLRSATGLVYGVAIIACLYFGVIPTAVIISAMAWLCCSEFFRMARLAGRMPNEILGLAIAVAYPLTLFLPFGQHVLVVTLVLVMGCAVWYVATPRANIADVAITAFGPIYTALTFSCIVRIRAVDPGWGGFFLTIGVMSSIWANDSFAYLVGSRIGKHKLAPRISPNKSTEGFWGGLLASIIPWAIMGIFHIEGLTLVKALAIGPVVGISSVIGDLFESRIKRGVGVKDSGDILPGHGGLLDRSDSMLFGGMVAYAFLHIGGII